MEMDVLWIILGGAFGGLIKAIFDGEHQLAKPVFVGNYFYLGFLGNIIIGIGAAIVGLSYFYSIMNVESIDNLGTLQLLATSIAFGIASNAVIEGIVEKISNGTRNTSA